MRPQPLICVNDVEAASRWYQRLLGCQSAHGGPNYERLVTGDGRLLWFELDDFDAAVARVQSMGAQVLLPRHRNPPDGNGGPNHWEIWLRDPDGYKVVLASPDGSADGNWRP
jgi:catechol 2,3-dioxygenase-like lactoylglutathione lyase family enzyme